MLRNYYFGHFVGEIFILVQLNWVIGTFNLFYIQIHLFAQMRGNRTKQQDWSKPFKMVFSKSEFEDLQTSDDTVINIQAKQSTSIVKQQIITPHIQTVRRVTDVKAFAKIYPNYVRLAPNLNVPKPQDYQLTEVDNVFIQTHRQRFKLNGKTVLSPQFMKTVIIALQMKQGKQQVIARSKAVLSAYLQKQFKELSKLQNYENLTDLLYNYWRNRRQELKFPLYRPLWRANQDEYNHLLAFKLRDKQKRSLRRSSRTSQDDIMEQMAAQLAMALKVAERIQMRQQLKQKQIQVQLTLFHQQLKSIFPPPDFIGQFSQQNRTKDKQRIRRFNQQVQKIRKQREVKSEEFKQPEPTIFDQKESVVNFIATVIAEAQLCGLSYQKLFHYRSEVPLPVFIPGSPKKDSELIQPEEEQCLNISLKRAGQYLLRHFEDSQDSSDSSTGEGQDQLNPIKRQMQRESYTDLFDFKKKLVSRFYFGEDDEGENQNLRKNISNSFKKFQASKQNQ